MDRSNLYNIIHLSLSFFLIFISYNVAQTFQTSSVNPKDGAFAVGIIYLVFCLTNLSISSYTTRLLGVRLTLILSSLTYVLFIAANIKYYRWTLFTSAFFLGIGAGLLWTAQGVYITVASSEYERVNGLVASSKRGLMNGLFFGVFCLNLTVGNLLTSFLFRLKYENWIIFSIMTGIAGFGFITLIFLPSIKMTEISKQGSILASLTIIFDLPFLLLIPSMCYSGLAQGFIYASIPPLILDNSLKFLIFAVYGITNAGSSIVFGKLSDSLCRRLVIFALGALAQMITFILLLIVWKPPLDQNRIEIFIILVIGLSIGDGVFMPQLSSLMTIFYGETRPADAFASMKVFQSIGTAIGFVAQVYLSFSMQLFYLIILLSLSLITLIYEHYGIKSLDTGKTIMSIRKRKKNSQETEIELQIPLAIPPDTA